MEKKEFSMEIGGKTLIAEFNDLADQTNSSVMLRYGDTTVLATAVMSKGQRDGLDYFPLTVDYEEKFYATGKILGSRFMRREGRPSDEAVLSGRIVDRTIRPLFDKNIRNDIQVVITVLSIDKDDPDVLAVIAASLALGTSDIPWGGPVSSVRIGKNGNNEFIINPLYEERENDVYSLDLLACGKGGKINMIEVGSKEIDEKTATEGLEKALREIEKIQKWQEEIISSVGKTKFEIENKKLSKEVVFLFEKEIQTKLETSVFSDNSKENIPSVKKEWQDLIKENLPDEDMNLINAFIEEKIDDLVHEKAVRENKRVDGRAMDEIRTISVKAGGISSIIHGSGVFYRGGTHILSALTLGGPQDSLIIDGMEEQTKKRFMHHYNFPPFSVGETGRIGGFNRRAIGHGALAEKALRPIIPPAEKFPYTIRIVSETMASNGSSSMGSVCASTLALMDAGVPIQNPVAGIAMGLMSTKDGYKILTDIQGPEDHYGDMDFKVAGTRDGITAVQMDIKIGGVSVEILSEAFEAAKKARLQILDKILEEIEKPRDSISPNAPLIEIIKINPEKIGLVIGSGGKTINGIKDETGVEIEIEDSGEVYITGGHDGVQRAKEIIQSMTKEYEVGEKMIGEVVKIADFGAFVKLDKNNDGLVHVSEIAPFRIDKIEKFLKVGQSVPVIVKEVDKERGRIALSIKEADPNFIKQDGKRE